MDNVNLLRKTLKPHLKRHGARLSFLALFLIALFRVRTVNLVDLLNAGIAFSMLPLRSVKPSQFIGRI